MTTTLAPGVYKDTPFKEYLSWPAVSKHDLDLISRSPAHYQAAKQHPQETTPAMLFGTAAHTWILEPEKAPAEVAIMPKVDRRTKAGKEEYEDWKLMHGHKTLVNSEDARHIAAMAAAVNNHAMAGPLLKDRKMTEASMCWQDDLTEALCRCRPDLISGDIVIDLKTTFDASKQAFQNTIAKYRYNVQAAYYLDGCKKLGVVSDDATFLFVVVERKPPYGVAVYALPNDDLERGRFQYQKDLGRYAHCEKTGHWFGYSERIDYANLPFYARKEIDALTGNE